MRVIATLNKHPKVSITVFSMNDKFVIKFEAGNMEQIYKVNQSEVNGLEGIEKLVTDKFVTEVIERFNAMFLSFKAAQEI